MKKRCTYGAGIFIFYCFTIGMSLYHHFHYLKMMCVMLLMWRKCGFAFCIALAHCYLNRISLRYTTKYIFLIDILLIWIKIFNFIDIFWFEFLIKKLLDGLVERTITYKFKKLLYKYLFENKIDDERNNNNSWVLFSNKNDFSGRTIGFKSILQDIEETTAQIHSYHRQWHSFKNSKKIVC